MKHFKRLISFALFWVIFCMLLCRVWRIFGFQDDFHSKAVFDQFYELPEDSVDVVWIGPSSVQVFAIPTLIYETAGITLYPLSVGNMPFNATEYMMKECQKTQTPQLYLIDIRDLAFSILSEESIRRVTDNMRFSLNRLKTIVKMTSDLKRFYPEQEVNLFDYCFSFVKYHTRWNQLIRTDFTDDDESYLGFWIWYENEPFGREEVMERFDAPETAIPEEDEVFLGEFLDFCDSFEGRVIFTCTPNCMEEEKFGQYNYIKRRIEARGYEVWDLNHDVDEMGLDYETDFGDWSHVNILGAQKVSIYMANKLDGRFDLEDHRGDSRYAIFEEKARLFWEGMERMGKEKYLQ